MHVLLAPSQSLDEAEVAVDLGQSPAEVVILSFSDSDLSALALAWSAQAETLPSLRLASLKLLKHPMSVDLYLDSVVGSARFVIVRCLGGLDYWRYGLECIAERARRTGQLFAALPGDARADPRLAALSTVPPDTLNLLDGLLREGGADNARTVLRVAANALGAKHVLDPPRRLGPIVAMTQAGDAVDIEGLCAAHTARGGGRLTALIVFYRSALLAADHAPIRALMAALCERGLQVAAVAVTSLKDPDVAGPLSHAVDQLDPAIVLNATAFSALREDDTTVLDGCDRVILQVALAGGSQPGWADSTRGLSAADLAMNVVLPELDGRLFTRAISFKHEVPLDARLQYAPVLHQPAPCRIDYVAALASAWVRLAAKPRDQRRLALVLSDYPARPGRTGYAVGLDTPASVAHILALLSSAGYDTADVDLSIDDVMNLLDGGSTSLDVPLADYRVWLGQLPDSLQSAIDQAWGAPEDDPACACGAFHFPCIVAGKVLVLVQPDRGAVGDRKQTYHDAMLPPRHSYVAAYACLRERERIDAMVHLGTHGTLEWLPGKAMALSAACWPEAVLGPVPVIYPFIVNNPGEALPAKRRLSAVTLGHLTPPLTDAGLHGPLAELEGLIEEFAEADLSDPRRAELIAREVVAQARQSGFADDCGVGVDQAPRVALAKLDAQLCDIKELAIRDRLHIFGQTPSQPGQSALAEMMAAASSGSGATIDVAQLEPLIAACGGAERAALLAALDARPIRPGPAGAPSRGRLDVLPTGRNLTTTDPRAIPTRTAARIGVRAAEEVIRRHLQDHGDYPRSVFIDLWASAVLRTGGDDLGQALYFLGVQPVWDVGSNRVTGVEVIPLAKLDRPRIDVTLRVSGLFRDIFASQIALFVSAIRLVRGLDEPPEWNPVAAADPAGAASHRVFGGAPGAYGAGVADLVLDGDWSSRAELAAAYLAAGHYAYDTGERGIAAAQAFAQRIAAADALIHPQDDAERDLLDGDGVADYVGGFAAAAAQLGNQPALYQLDTSRPFRPVARALPEELARLVRGRLTNPRWITGMLSHGHRGIAEIAQGVDAVFAFAATTDAVHHGLFDALHAALIADPETAEAMRAANPAAAGAIALRLQDALARGLWVPRRNAVHAELKILVKDTVGAPDAEVGRT